MAKSLQSFEAEQSEIVKHLQAQLDAKDRVLDDYKKNTGQLEVLSASVVAAVVASDPVPILYNPKDEPSTTEVMGVHQNTDWHIGAQQNADEIERINEYNYSIAHSRVEDLTHRSNRLIERLRGSYKIRNGVLICTGDMISGDIHDELTRTNEFPVPIQVVKAAELFAAGVTVISQNYANLRVEYMTADNHSRLTRKPQAKEQGINSFNYLVAVIAEKILSRMNNIEFNINTEPQKVVPVLNMRYLAMHGHQIKAWSGHAWYGWDRKVGKESTSRLAMIMDEPERMDTLGFNKIVAGHFHEPIDTLHFSIGGSLSGTDAYDRDNGRYAPPSQPIWLVSEKYGEFGRVNFSL